jgi:stress-induced morphogen
MALQIINAGPPPEEIAGRIHAAIASKLPDAAVEVLPQGPGHFEIKVTDAAFDGLTRVKQQQLVYSAIANLMAGTNPLVHAIDRLECLVS